MEIKICGDRAGTFPRVDHATIFIQQGWHDYTCAGSLLSRVWPRAHYNLKGPRGQCDHSRPRHTAHCSNKGVNAKSGILEWFRCRYLRPDKYASSAIVKIVVDMSFVGLLIYWKTRWQYCRNALLMFWVSIIFCILEKDHFGQFWTD